MLSIRKALNEKTPLEYRLPLFADIMTAHKEGNFRANNGRFRTAADQLWAIVNGSELSPEQREQCRTLFYYFMANSSYKGYKNYRK